MEPVNKKETTKEYNKNYYEKNKEKHLKNLKQKIYCECCDKHISKVNMQKEEEEVSMIKKEKKTSKFNCW